jgi:hypothetical protein
LCQPGVFINKRTTRNAGEHEAHDKVEDGLLHRERRRLLRLKAFKLASGLRFGDCGSLFDFARRCRSCVCVVVVVFVVYVTLFGLFVVVCLYVPLLLLLILL